MNIRFSIIIPCYNVEKYIEECLDSIISQEEQSWEAICTDDGSEGFKGLVTAMLEKLVTEDGKVYDQAVAIGPMIMMKFVTMTAAKCNLPLVESLNTLMVDGTGMCGACRVTVGGKTRFACVEGPEFDAHQIDFDEAMARGAMYRDFERHAHEATCNLFAKEVE